MMPFSVLRIWGLGLFSWLLLGLGIYLGVQAYDQFRDQRDARAIVVADSFNVRDDVGPTDARTTDAVAPTQVRTETFDWRPWAFLAGAIACLGLTVGGAWPAKWLISGSNRGVPPSTVAPSKTLTVDRPDGTALHVEVYGDDTRPTLLCTHGWSLDASAWDYCKTELLKKYRIVTWDLPGLGRSTSPKNGDFSIEKLAHDLEAVLRATATPMPLILVGHSIGGMTLQTFCRLHPEHLKTTVKGLALVHTTYTNPIHTNFAAPLTKLIEKPIIVPLNYLTIALAPLVWLSNWQSYFNGSLHITTRFTSFSGSQTREQLDHGAKLAAKAWPAAFARGNLAMLQFDEQGTLPKLKIPVLVIAGEYDRMTVAAASSHIESLLPDDRPTSVPGGHLGYWERADEVAELLSEFCDALTGQSITKAAASQAPAAATRE